MVNEYAVDGHRVREILDYLAAIEQDDADHCVEGSVWCDAIAAVALAAAVTGIPAAEGAEAYLKAYRFYELQLQAQSGDKSETV